LIIKNILRRILNPILIKVFRIVHNKPILIASKYPKINKYSFFSIPSHFTFFGYHDKTPFSGDDSKILSMNVKHNDTSPHSECKEIDLGYFHNLPSNGIENSFVKFSSTGTWCWQQGCMLQWDPSNPNSRVFYNTLVDGQCGAHLFNIQKAKVVTSFPNPIYSISADGKLAISLNFSRLGRLRPGYGYSLLPDSTLNDPCPNDDGIYLMNLQTGKIELLINLYELSLQVNCEPGDEHYINHASFSSDGLRIVFFHIWKLFNSNKRKIRFCSYELNTSKLSVIEDVRTTSHYCWRDDNTILATNVDQFGTWRYTLYDLGNNIKKDLQIDLQQDGHPMFSPVDKDIFITDTYPDKRGDQHLCLVDLKNNKIYELIALYSPLRYRGQVRCDLHPRWDREGKFVCVDTTSNGKREMLIIDLKEQNKGNSAN
jgi:hypothetical protein